MTVAGGAPGPVDGPPVDPARSAPLRWAAGRWSLEVRGDELADIRCDGRLVLRAVRAVARDVDWATPWPRVAAVGSGDDALTLHLRFHDLGLDLTGTLRTTADEDRLGFDLDLEALTDSPTNRVGLVVLHPPQLAGTPLHVAHPDGGDSALGFPVQVSQHQPAKDIVQLAWAAGDLPLRLAFEGDVFEMEDQRNWTDASFKTYSRPLDLPFPYTLTRGERVRQRVLLTAGAASLVSDTAHAGPRHERLGQEPGDTEELTWRRGGTIPVIGTGYLDLELADPAWSLRLRAALKAAGGQLALWIVSPAPPDPSAFAELSRLLSEAGAALRFIGIADAQRHVTTPELAAALRAAAPEDVPVVAGTRSHFTELNREWDTVLAARPEALAFATTPLFHTLETEQLVESVAMQRLLAAQLTVRAPGLPVHIGPITLRPRFANVATSAQPVPAPGPPADARAGTALHEAWTVASAAAFSMPGVASLTYEHVPAKLIALGRRSGAHAAGTEEGSLITGSSEDGLVWAIGDGADLLLANLSDRPRRVRIPGRAAPCALDPVSWSTV